MPKYSPDVEAEIRRRSGTFGIALGILALPLSLLASHVLKGFPGPVVGMLPVVHSGALAGLLAAAFFEGGKIPPKDSLGVGLKVGLRTAWVASSLAATTILIFSFLSETGTAQVSLEPIPASRAAVDGTGVAHAMVLLLGIAPGVLCGSLGGMLGSLLKKRTGSP